MDGVPLEPDGDAVRSLTEEALEYLVAFTNRRADAPASDFTGLDEALARVRTPPPEEGRPLADVLDTVAAAGSVGHDTTGDGWMAYVPGGGLFTSALADLIAKTQNRFVNLWEPAPVAAELEATALRWLCGLFAFPPEARGTLTTGG